MRASARAVRSSDAADTLSWVSGTTSAVCILHISACARRSIGSNMRPVLALVIALALGASPKALANEMTPLQLKVPKSALATASLASHPNAPFNTPLGEPDLGLVQKHEVQQEQSRSSCANASALCYDAAENRIVFKPARNYMPDLPGLTRENITVKRDRIVFRYTW